MTFSEFYFLKHFFFNLRNTTGLLKKEIKNRLMGNVIVQIKIVNHFFSPFPHIIVNVIFRFAKTQT